MIFWLYSAIFQRRCNSYKNGYLISECLRSYMKLFSGWNGPSLLFLLRNHSGACGSVLRLEVVLPVFWVFGQVLLEGQLRVHPFQSISQMIDVLIRPPGSKTSLNQSEVSFVELFSFDRIVDLQNIESSHHLCCFHPISLDGHHGRYDDLKVGPNRH